MENADLTLSPQANQLRWSKLLIPAALSLGVLIILLIGLQAQPTNQFPSSEPLLSQADFEEQSGLIVRLIGVTGGGGMVDLRLKITDAGKAQQFLLDPGNLPIMLITENGAEILAADSLDEEILWTEGGILFMMLPNTNESIQAGNSVTLKFGDVLVEPIPAQ